MDNLSQIFEKEEDNWNEDDEFLLEAVSDFMGLAVTAQRKTYVRENYEPDDFHYVFIFPFEWGRKITEKIFRSVFIRGGLISTDDHKDRILFYSDIECICYNLQSRSVKNYPFKRGENSILCKLTTVKNKIVLVRLYLIQTAITLSNASDSKLFPKVLVSDSFYISQDDIINCIQVFLQSEDKLSGIGLDKIKTLAKRLYHEDLYTLGSDVDLLMEPIISDTSRWELSESQATFIKSIRIYDICYIIGKDLIETAKRIIPNNLVKNYNLTMVYDNYSCKFNFSLPLRNWIDYIFEYSIPFLNDIAKITRTDFYSDLIDQHVTFTGAALAVTEIIRYSNMCCSPRIVSSKNLETSSSVFQNSTPNAIISIDISLNSTLVSYSLLDNNGLIDKMFENNYFTKNECLPSLGQFYSVSNNAATLYVKKQFIIFADIYLLDSSNHLVIEKNISKKEKIMLDLKSILKNDHSEKKMLVPIKQKIYIKAFALMYMFYIQYLILCKPSVHSGFEPTNIRVGYAITIEKILLENLIGTKEDFRELIYESKLISKYDTCTKLRIMTVEEEILPVIQQSLNLKFPIRSNIVLAQLHNDYVQLTLNHVVTTYTSEEEGQEVIVIQDEIIPIQNIYDASCSNMWEIIVQNRGLINLCEIHGRSDYDILELLSLKTKTQFISNLKEHISQNILANYSSLKNLNKHNIQLSKLCSCNICVTENDIIDICLKPTVQDITVIVLTTLINKKIFGIYTDINYIFGLIHFNSNPRLQNILITIMEEKKEYFSPKRGIEVDFLILPITPSQLLRSVLGQRPLSYKGFQFGTFKQVFNSNLVIEIEPFEMNYVGYTYKNKITDTESIELTQTTQLLLFKKGDIICNNGLTKVIYVKRKEKPEKQWKIELNLAEFDGFGENDTFEQHYFLRHFQLEVKTEQFDLVDGFPIMVTVVFQYHTSTLRYSVKLVGGVHSDYNWFHEAGEFITLDRF